MSNALIWILFSAIVVIYCIYMFITIIRRNRSDRKEWEGRLDSLKGEAAPVNAIREKLLKDVTSKDDSKRKSKLSSKIKKVTSLRHWLKYTGYAISPLQLFLAILVFALLLMFFNVMFFKANVLVAALLGILLAGAISFGTVYILIARQKAKFLVAFPDTLDLVRRALRAGYAADRAIVMASEESPEPLKSTLAGVVDRVSIGDPLEEALGDAANEAGIDEFHMLAIVLVLQRDTGGSLADVIENFANIMRERIRLQKKVKAITAEGKASGTLVSAIPFVIIIILQFLAPNYLDPLFHTDQGHDLLMFGGGLMALGIFIIYRMVTKDYY